ncbi:MAG: hypothetical protein OEV28_04030 [Nitrospirota bacterium]|nr:hypothetical protein [Nitrospirota bacterium]
MFDKVLVLSILTEIDEALEKSRTGQVWFRYRSEATSSNHHGEKKGIAT